MENDGLYREHLELGINIIENFLEEIYITKRFLVTDGIPEDVIDNYIEENVNKIGESLSAMTEDEFTDYIVEFQQEIGEKVAAAEDADYPEDDAAINEGMIRMIADKIKALMTVVRGLTGLGGADPEDLAQAIMDKAEEVNELYMNMSPEEFHEEVMGAIADIEED